MPITKQAIKKMRHDRAITQQNEKMEQVVHDAIKSFRKAPSAKKLTDVFSLLDKAGKRNAFHQNKVSRLKSRLSHLIAAK